MNKVAITTNSACVFADEAKEKGVTIIPFHIIIEGKDYLDPQVDMESLYALLARKENLPTTAPFTVVECFQTWQELSQNAEAILHISMTQAFTAAYTVALQAQGLAREKLPETKIQVIDSRTTGSGLGLMTLEAAEMAAQGKDVSEITEFVNHLIPRMNFLSMRDTLLYLDKGGRIFEAKSWAEAEHKLCFRAIVEIDGYSGGVTKPAARVKTRRQAMDKTVKIAKERAGDGKLHIFIGHTRTPEEAEELKNMFESDFNCDKIYVHDESATVAVFNGRNLIEVAFYTLAD